METLAIATKFEELHTSMRQEENEKRKNEVNDNIKEKEQK